MFEKLCLLSLILKVLFCTCLFLFLCILRCMRNGNRRHRSYAFYRKCSSIFMSNLLGCYFLFRFVFVSSSFALQSVAFATQDGKKRARWQIMQGASSNIYDRRSLESTSVFSCHLSAYHQFHWKGYVLRIHQSTNISRMILTNVTFNFLLN